MAVIPLQLQNFLGNTCTFLYIDYKYITTFNATFVINTRLCDGIKLISKDGAFIRQRYLLRNYQTSSYVYQVMQIPIIHLVQDQTFYKFEN